jgi:glycosyltransferase involved in cell wall biosynthesis
MMSNRVTAVVPALNEERAIASVVEAVLAHGMVNDVVVVDGGSSDATAERARVAGARVVVERRRGYGRAWLTGARHAGGAEVVLFVDGDGSDSQPAKGRP